MSVELQHPLFQCIKAEWRVYNFGMDGLVYLVMDMHVPDRDVPKGIVEPSYFHSRPPEQVRNVDLQVIETFNAYMARGTDAEILKFVSEWARSVIQRTVCHEVDEMLLVNGKRVFDPHARDGL
jgi:hypothetical protein